MSIRLRILAVLSVMLALACGLAFYAILAIDSAGQLVVRLYDGPLMGINHARAAHAALNEARLILQQGQSVVVACAPSLPREYNEALEGLEIGAGSGPCGAGACESPTVVASDIAIDPQWAHHRGLALAHGLRACWWVPVRSPAGAVFGMCAVYLAEPRTPSAADLMVVERAAVLGIQRAVVVVVLAPRQELGERRAAVAGQREGFEQFQIHRRETTCSVIVAADVALDHRRARGSGNRQHFRVRRLRIDRGVRRHRAHLVRRRLPRRVVQKLQRRIM